MSCATTTDRASGPTVSDRIEAVNEAAREKATNAKDGFEDYLDDRRTEAEILKEDAPVLCEEANRRAEDTLRRNRVGEWVLLNGPQQIVSVAVGIMATLMIGVVVLGQIDGFTPSLSGDWQNVSSNVSDQSAQTFNFLNLVPFIIVALFVLGLMMSRMG